MAQGAAGKLIYVAAEGDDLEIGALVAKIDTSVEAPVTAPVTAPAPTAPAPAMEETPTSAPEATPAPASTSYAKGHPSPAAGKILDEKGIDASNVAGTGKGGRITKADAVVTCDYIGW